MKKPLIVGQAPGAAGLTKDGALAGRAGARLADLCGLSLEAFLERFDRINLLERFPGKDGHGDAFPMGEAQQRADELREVVAARDRVVLLGWNVAHAFRIGRHVDSYFQWTRFFKEGGDVCVAPHPSGVSHFWNHASHRAAAQLFWRSLALGPMRCARCHRPMNGSTPVDGACACGGLIEPDPGGRK